MMHYDGSQVEIGTFSNISLRAWKPANANENRHNFREICVFLKEALLSTFQYEICPPSAGNGSLSDYAMRPASRWRWAQFVRRDTGECLRKKPACAAGRLCFIAPFRRPVYASVLILGFIHRADDEPVCDGGEGVVVIAGGRFLVELVP